MNGSIGQRPMSLLRNPTSLPYRLSGIASGIRSMMAEIQCATAPRPPRPASTNPQPPGSASTAPQAPRPASTAPQTSSQAPVVPQASGEATSNDPSGDTTSNGSLANPASNDPSADPPAPALPQNEDAISIRNTGDKRGLGVFSNHDFPNKHVVIFETPVLTTISISIGRRKFNSVAKEWLKLSQAKKIELHESFRKLRGISIDPPLSRSDKKRLKKFVAEYAFREMIPTDRAYIFKLACHINHACADCANCTTWVDSDGPHRISVKLRKPVRAGDELFIHYGKPLRYQCAVCRSSRSRRALAVVGRAASNLGMLVRREDSQTI